MSKTEKSETDKPSEQRSELHPLVEMLTLEQLDTARFRTNRHIPNHRSVLFGGQVLSQALVATTQTVNDRTPHSLHGYFLRAGSSALAVDYEVQSLRDGGSFSTRRVDAIQEDKIIFTMDVSFHSPEPGISHQQALTLDVPRPEDCRSMQDYADESPFPLRGFVSAMNIMDMRAVSVDGYFNDKVVEPQGLFWFKMNGVLPEEPIFHRCALAMMSDRALMATCALQHPICMFDSTYLSASLDHAVWFHGDYPVNQWLLYVTESPWAGEGRGLNRGSIYTQDGMLVATTTQEGLIRKLS